MRDCSGGPFVLLEAKRSVVFLKAEHRAHAAALPFVPAHGVLEELAHTVTHKWNNLATGGTSA